MIMITDSEARTIAAGWISPSPADANLTAFATGHPRWTLHGLIDEVNYNISDVQRSPEQYDEVDDCLTELRALYEWATAPDTVIARAAEHGITLDRSEFVLIDGAPTLDGMDPAEWLDAMTMD